MSSVEYQLTVKSANQKVDDYTLNCRSDWTVLRLKQHISETHVNKPNIKDQRLIYAGNLLKDSLTLRQVFFRDSLCTELTNSNKTDFTIHLVCSNSSQKTQTAPGSSSSNLASTQSTSTRSSSGPPTVTPSSSSTVNPSGTSPANSHNPNHHATNETNPISTARMSYTQVPGIVTDLLQSEQMRQQLATLQQLANMVANELTQNLANNLDVQTNNEPSTAQAQVPFLLSDLSGLLNLSQQANISTFTTTATPMSSAQQNEDVLAANSIATRLFYAGHPNHAEQNLPGGRNVNNTGIRHEPDGHQLDFNRPDQPQARAAVGGLQQPRVPAPQAPIVEPAIPGERDPVLQHDVIDWVYYSIRAMVLIAALYIHASIFRLLFIFGLLAIAFFFSRRSHRRQNQPAAAAPNAAQLQQPPIQVDNRPVPNGEAQMEQGGELRRRRVNGQEPLNGDDNATVGNDGADRAQLVDADGEVAQRRVSFFKLCYLVIADFLASLVPE